LGWFSIPVRYSTATRNPGPEKPLEQCESTQTDTAIFFRREQKK